MIRTKHIYALCLLLSLGYTSGLSVLNDTSITDDASEELGGKNSYEEWYTEHQMEMYGGISNSNTRTGRELPMEDTPMVDYGVDFGSPMDYGCEEGSTWMIACIRCTCIDGLGSCSDNTCAPNTDCGEEGATWKDECNFCYCFDGRVSCSDNTCLPDIERGSTLIELSGSNIIDGSEFMSFGSGPHSLLTEEDIWKPNHRPWFVIFDFIETYKVNNVTIINTGDSVHDVTSFKIQSSNDNQWWTFVDVISKVTPGDDQPQFFSISGEGRYWKLTIQKTASQYQPWVNYFGFFGDITVVPGTDNKPECLEGSRWTEQCNICTCRSGYVACTNKICLPECIEGSYWTVDCNICECYEGHVTCTTKNCLSDPVPTCTEGSRWYETSSGNCNTTCICSIGVTTCTEEICPPEKAEDDASEELGGQNGYEELNTEHQMEMYGGREYPDPMYEDETWDGPRRPSNVDYSVFYGPLLDYRPEFESCRPGFNEKQPLMYTKCLDCTREGCQACDDCPKCKVFNPATCKCHKKFGCKD